MRKIVTLYFFGLVFGLTIAFGQTESPNVSTIDFPEVNYDLPDVGENVNVPIYVQDMPELYSITIRFTYNQEVLEYVGTASEQIDVTSVTQNSNYIQFVLGEFTLPNPTSYNVDGLLFEAVFKFKGGNTEVTFISNTTNAANGTNYFSASTFTQIAITDLTNGSVNGGNPTNTITSGTWSEATDWSTGVVPNSFHNVVVGAGAKGLVTLNSDEVANSVTIQDGGQLTQDAATTLIVTEDFTIESGGSFIQNGTLSAANKIAERDVQAWSTSQDGWHLLSSPVASQAIDPGFTGTAGTFDFFSWNEPNQLWYSTDGNLADVNFVPGKGYLVAYQSTATKEFYGDFNTADVEGLTLSNSGSEDPYGFNLFGNPYPSALTWATGWTLGTNVQTTAYVWDEFWKRYEPVTAGGVIPAMNGFMVYQTSGSGTLDIPATARTHNSQSWYKNDEEKVELIAHDPSNQSAQKHIIRFNASASEDYDRDFDAVFMSGYAPKFYSHGGGKSLMVNTLPSHSYETVIPISFEKNEGQEYVIELADNTTGQQVFLTDLKLGTTISLSDHNLYEFTSEDADLEERFELKFSTVGLEENDLNEPKVYAVDNMLVIENLKEQTNISVFNLNGQLMSQFKTTANNRFEERLNVNDGVYMIRLQSANSVTSKKVFIK